MLALIATRPGVGSLARSHRVAGTRRVYLTTVLEENDSALLAAALGDIARSRGMTQVAKDSGIAREALYKALRPGSDPRFDTQ
jgi:probable addiction module antidote protein